MSADPSARRLHLWSGLIILGVFLAGAVAGAGVFAWLRPPPPPMMGPPPPGELPRPLRELNLTAEQREKAKAIFERHRATVEALIQESFPRVRAAQEQMDRELRAILTEEQARKFDELQARRPPRPPGGPGLGGPPPDGMPPPPPPRP
jgi:Spy/CpxP family protein refolding chaperone